MIVKAHYQNGHLILAQPVPYLADGQDVLVEIHLPPTGEQRPMLPNNTVIIDVEATGAESSTTTPLILDFPLQLALNQPASQE